MLSVLITVQSEFGVKRPVDDEIILKIANGDMEALHELYENTSSAVFGFALSITKNSYDAEDVLQEIFLKVYEKAGDYVPRGKPMAWIFTIARNSALDKLRSRGKSEQYDEAHPEGIDFSLIHQSEERMVLETMFRILTDEEKQIIMLHAVSGMKHREIAGIMNLSLNTVLSKYRRAIKKLKLIVEEEQL